MNYDEYNALGQAIDTTWGRSSTAGTRDNASMSVKAHLLGENLLVLTYMTVISFGDIAEREREIKRYGDEANGVLDAALARVKRDFKELAGRTLKSKQVKEDWDWELLTLGQFSGRRDAYYRKKVVIEVT